jgi:hypothetical protein
VLEAYPRADDVGGSFQIAPNGVRVLAELGHGVLAYTNAQHRELRSDAATTPTRSLRNVFFATTETTAAT